MNKTARILEQALRDGRMPAQVGGAPLDDRGREILQGVLDLIRTSQDTEEAAAYMLERRGDGPWDGVDTYVNDKAATSMAEFYQAGGWETCITPLYRRPTPCSNAEDPTSARLAALRAEQYRGWGVVDNVTCVVCPHCGFTFASTHVGEEGNGFTCPNCARRDDEEERNGNRTLLR